MKWFLCSLIIMSVLSLGAVGTGCSTMTEDERIQKEFTMLEKRAERHDKILGSRARCEAKGLVWWINPGFSTWEIRRMARDLDWLPRGAHRADFACVTNQEAMRAVNRMLEY